LVDGGVYGIGVVGDEGGETRDDHAAAHGDRRPHRHPTGRHRGLANPTGGGGERGFLGEGRAPSSGGVIGGLAD